MSPVVLPLVEIKVNVPIDGINEHIKTVLSMTLVLIRIQMLIITNLLNLKAE